MGKKTAQDRTKSYRGGSFRDAFAQLGMPISEEAKKEDEERQKKKELEEKNKYRKGYIPSGKSKDQRGKKDYSNTYVGAPYNFVPFTERVQSITQDSLISHASMDAELFTGEIAYHVKAHTPIFVGGETENSNGREVQKFYRTTDGKYAIPGSSIRGLIRSHVQILGFSAMGEDIDDYSLMYRAVGAPNVNPNKEPYKEILGEATEQLKKSSISVLKNVRAGYITCKNGKYRIFKTVTGPIDSKLGEMNYFVISERYIIENHLKNPDDDRFVYLFENNYTQNSPDAHFEKYIDKYGRTHYKGRKNAAYTPFYAPISYEREGVKGIHSVQAPGILSSDGVLVGTGFMNEKKALYVIPAVDSEESVEIPDKDIKAYNIDYEKKKNTLTTEVKDKSIIQKLKAYFALPEEGEIRPVFYIELGSRLYFGYTPRLRLFYDNTIKDGLPDSHKKEDQVDLEMSMFGFNKKTGYKSKLSFSDAEMKSGSSETKLTKAVLGEPKPTSFADYLKTDNGFLKSYTDGFRLRGVKQYWLHDSAISNENPKNEKVASKFCPLSASAEFAGVIRFKNLTKTELGLLLWSVRLEKESHVNIGKAKALGFGNVSIVIDEVKLLDMKRAYSLDVLDMDPWDRKIDIDAFVSEYKENLQSFAGVTDIMEHPVVKSFFLMKNDAIKPDLEKIRFMSIDNNEYNGKRRPLTEDLESLCKKSEE